MFWSQFTYKNGYIRATNFLNLDISPQLHRTSKQQFDAPPFWPFQQRALSWYSSLYLFWGPRKYFWSYKNIVRLLSTLCTILNTVWYNMLCMCVQSCECKAINFPFECVNKQSSFGGLSCNSFLHLPLDPFSFITWTSL